MLSEVLFSPRCSLPEPLAGRGVNLGMMMVLTYDEPSDDSVTSPRLWVETSLAFGYPVSPPSDIPMERAAPLATAVSASDCEGATTLRKPLDSRKRLTQGMRLAPPVRRTSSTDRGSKGS